MFGPQGSPLWRNWIFHFFSFLYFFLRHARTKSKKGLIVGPCQSNNLLPFTFCCLNLYHIIHLPLKLFFSFSYKYIFIRNAQYDINLLFLLFRVCTCCFLSNSNIFPYWVSKFFFKELGHSILGQITSSVSLFSDVTRPNMRICSSSSFTANRFQ